MCYDAAGERPPGAVPGQASGSLTLSMAFGTVYTGAHRAYVPHDLRFGPQGHGIR